MGSEHPDLAVWLNNLANLLLQTSRLDGAKPLYQRAVKILRASHGNDHPKTKKVIANYGKFKAMRDKS